MICDIADRAKASNLAFLCCGNEFKAIKWHAKHKCVVVVVSRHEIPAFKYAEKVFLRYARRNVVLLSIVA